MTTCELEFLTGVCRDHAKTLDEQTIVKLLEYFHKVQQKRPYLGHALKLGSHICDLVKQFVEASEVTRYVEKTIVPVVLSAYQALKTEELEQAAA